MDVANEILDAIEIIVDKKIKEQTTQIYPGICKSVNGNSCVMSINGKDNTVQFYGSAPIVGTIYRVFVPYGNMSMAFIITANDNGSSASGVSSVNGLTGDVNLIASDVGAAPAGYGLGGGATKTVETDFNNYIDNGVYMIPGSTESIQNAPPIGIYGMLEVSRGSNAIIQDVWGPQWGYPYVSWVHVRRVNTTYNANPDMWSEWEWPEPPFMVGTVYRTTEKYINNPVYKKMDSNGVIWWSTDQSTWKREAERVGAAPAGYGLGGNAATPTTNDANSCTLTGWYAISSMSNCPFTYGLLRVEKWYDGCIFQTAYEMGSGVVVQRRYQSSEWNPWEYVNPPMQLGVEYRTTERYNGKPVYCKLVNFGKLPNNAYKDVAHGISNLQYTISVSGESNGDNLIGNMYITYVNIGSKNIRIKTNADRSGVGATVLIKYTKTID